MNISNHLNKSKLLRFKCHHQRNVWFTFFFSLESCNAHRLVKLVYFSLSSWEKDYQKSQTGSNLCFIPTPSEALIKSNNY